MWRLFRETLEGLAYIHTDGQLIHRDLKPDNIFLDSHDHVKIGDFGLATTTSRALKQRHIGDNVNSSSPTGEVGTSMYVAPELMGDAWKSTYDQKVDIYSLGIIFFEMCHQPFATGMERCCVLTALRSSDIIIPSSVLLCPEFEQKSQIIKWLLKHDQNQRPNAVELLDSDLMPPKHVEKKDLQLAVRHILANPDDAHQSDAVVYSELTSTDKKHKMMKVSVSVYMFFVKLS